MPLSDDLVEVIFKKLTMTYGQRFLLQWAGMDLAEIRADWAHELAGYAKRPEAIAHALKNLPAEAPNVQDFRRLCRGAPVLALPKLPPPSKDNPALREAATALAAGAKCKPRGWAAELRERELAGERLNPVQRAAWRNAWRPDEDEQPADESPLPMPPAIPLPTHASH